MPSRSDRKKKQESQHKVSNETIVIQSIVQSRLGRKLLDILYETLVLLFYIFAISMLHKALVHWVGEDAKLLDIVPVRYIIDTGHLLVIGKFFLEIISDVPDIIREMRKQK